MKMSWRWYGSKNDDITLNQIKQIPGVESIVWSLHDKVAGEEWHTEEIESAVKEITDSGFSASIVESVNVHDDIKIGKDTRDKYIDVYIDTIRKLAKAGVKIICYNFMPVFDWTRTDLYRKTPDGSNAFFYERKLVEGASPKEMMDNMMKAAKDKSLPGWEHERLADLNRLFDEYKDITEEKLFENCKYFLERIMPVCEECDVRMAIHPDDPPWPIFGLPRIIRSRDHIKKFLDLVPSEYNGLTICSGSLGPDLENDIPAIIREFGDKIYFAHVRNVKIYENGDFIETSHRECDGDIEIIEIMKAYHDIEYKGYIRPDHGRHLWGEEKHCVPGYGLYDRALGVMYLLGIWDTLEKYEVK